MIRNCFIGISIVAMFVGTSLASEGNSSAAENMKRRRISYITKNIVEYADLADEGALRQSRDADLEKAGLVKTWSDCLDLANAAVGNNITNGDGSSERAFAAFYQAAYQCVSRLEEQTQKELCGLVLLWD